MLQIHRPPLPRRRTQLTRRRDNTRTDYREQLDQDINNEQIRQAENRPSNRISETSSTRNDYKKKSSSKSSSNPNVHFPKKNLFPKLPKFNSLKDKEVDSVKSTFHHQTKSSGRSRGCFSRRNIFGPLNPFNGRYSK